LKLDRSKKKFENKSSRNITEEDIRIQKVTKISSLLLTGINSILEYLLIENFISEQEFFNLKTINGEKKENPLKDLNSKCEMEKNFKKLDIESL